MSLEDFDWEIVSNKEESIKCSCKCHCVVTKKNCLKLIIDNKPYLIIKSKKDLYKWMDNNNIISDLREYASEEMTKCAIKYVKELPCDCGLLMKSGELKRGMKLIMSYCLNGHFSSMNVPWLYFND